MAAGKFAALNLGIGIGGIESDVAASTVATVGIIGIGAAALTGAWYIGAAVQPVWQVGAAVPTVWDVGAAVPTVWDVVWDDADDAAWVDVNPGGRCDVAVTSAHGFPPSGVCWILFCPTAPGTTLGPGMTFGTGGRGFAGGAHDMAEVA